ncbi:MAG TPA: response regulator transcription factor [Gallionella sp.]|nr:response regulator transcription factor [Gallionella sp.]
MVTRLMITDDHELVRSGLVQFMATSPDVQVVAEASCGADLLEKLRSVQVDVLLLDLVMPGICGAELVARVRGSNPNLRILVLSMHNDTQTVLRAMKAGASGYITKNCSPQTLLDAVRKIAATGKYLDPEMAERLAFASSSADVDDVELTLSEREMQIFRLIVEGKCIKAIANELSISDKTVSTHKAHILAKLGLKSVADLVRYAMQGKLFP